MTDADKALVGGRLGSYWGVRVGGLIQIFSTSRQRSPTILFCHPVFGTNRGSRAGAFFERRAGQWYQMERNASLSPGNGSQLPRSSSAFARL